MEPTAIPEPVVEQSHWRQTMRVLFVTPYPHHSADTRYRIEQFLPGLQQAGIHTELRPFMSERFFEIYTDPEHTLEKALEFARSFAARLRDVLVAGQFDAAFIHKEAFAFGPPVIEMLLRWRSGALIFDLDDAFWTHPPQLRQIGRRWRDPERVPKIIRMSDHVIAGNASIAEHVRQYNTQVTVIPTVIDTNRYKPCSTSPDPGWVTVGWVGRWSSSFYLNRLAPVFRDLCARYPQVQIKLIGAQEPDWPGVRLISQPWRLETEIEDIQSFDIGLMPLDDDEYSRYKCGFKMLQYMGVGIPAVVSPVGVNRDIIQEGANGFLADSLEAWRDKLSRLIESPGLRAELGAAGRRTMEEYYSLTGALPSMRQVIEQAGRRYQT